MKKIAVIIMMFGVKSIFCQNTYPTNGNVYFDTSLKIGKQEAAANTAGEIVRLSLQPYGHTAGPWNFKARDISGFAYLDVVYGLGSPIFTVGSDKNVGIGTITPSANLEIKSTAVTGAETLMKLTVSDAPQDYLKISNGTNTGNQFLPTIEGYKMSDNRSVLYITGSIDASNDNGTNPLMVFDSRMGTTSVVTRPLFAWDSYGARKMTLNSNGSLGIGTTTTGTHKLAVEGSIASREVKVLATGWADFVFKKDYDLPTLQEVEKHIQEKEHLADIPSEQEVLKNGINLGEMNAKLLQKIEELTLYVIDQNKEILNLKNRLNNLESSKK